MIKKLKLKNFRQHSNTVVEFSAGVNTIVGANNSGKSTLPEAIEYAMYGARALRDNAKAYIQDGNSDGSSIIELSLNGDTYIVGRSSKNAEIKKNGQLDARYKANVTQYVSRITGVNHTGFRLGHYVRQKELSAFSGLRPGKRHEAVEKMLKINAVDKAIAAYKEDIDMQEIQQKMLISKYQDLDALENEHSDLTEALSILFNDESTLKNDLTKIGETLTEQRERQLKLARKPELEKLRNYLEATKSAEIKLAKVRQDLEKLDTADEGAFETLKNKVAASRELEREAISMAAKKTEIDQLVALNRPKFIEEPILPSKDDLNVALLELKNKTNEINSLTAIKDNANCPTCLQPLDELKLNNLLDRLHTEAEKANEKIRKKQQAYDAAKEEYNTKKEDYFTYQVAHSKYEADLTRRNKLIQEYVEVAFDAKAQEAMEAELEELRSLITEKSLLSSKRESLEAEAAKRGSLEEDIERLAYLDELNDEPGLADLILANSSKSKDINQKLQQKASERARIEGRLLELDRLIVTMCEAKRSINVNANKIADLKLQRDSFVMFKRHLTSKIRPMLQDLAETLFHKTTKNRYAAYNLASDYEISLTTHSGYARKLTTISGSENDLACLCLRLAIATLRNTKLAGSLGFVILDEISGSFDDERTKQTLEGLLELKDVIPQIINITHKPVEMRFADKIITVKETNGIATIS